MIQLCVVPDLGSANAYIYMQTIYVNKYNGHIVHMLVTIQAVHSLLHANVPCRMLISYNTFVSEGWLMNTCLSSC